MTVDQHALINTATGTNTVTLIDAFAGAQAAATLNAEVETFVLAVGANSVTTGATNQTINANNLLDGEVLTLAGTHNVSVSLVAGDLTSTSSGNVFVTATTGTNVIVTGSGNDVITGGAGADVLTGGAGADTFVMVAADAGDTITDFTTGTDFFDFNTALLATGGGAALVFESAAAGTAIGATTTVFELTGVTTAGSAANLVTALGATATNADIAAGDSLLFVNYLTAGGAQIWHFVGADANVDEAELTLLATLNGVAADALVAQDFI